VGFRQALALRAFVDVIVGEVPSVAFIVSDISAFIRTDRPTDE